LKSARSAIAPDTIVVAVVAKDSFFYMEASKDENWYTICDAAGQQIEKLRWFPLLAYIPGI
jgi:hypothetical protein